jgi:NAD(P)-dependent dehydrogenase (short-subunit alcohol dehydrogenase family)
MRIVVADLDQTRCDQFAEELKAQGATAVGVAVSVTSQASTAEMAKKVINTFGQIDVLVNNAGVIALGSLVDLDEESWDRVINVNLKGPFLCAKAVAPHMIAQTRGRIINISSVAGKRPAPLQSAYAASKHGVIGLTQVWCQELAAHNISVNSICPGFIDSLMWQDHLGPALGPAFNTAPADLIKTLSKALMPLGRPQTAEDIGDAVAYFSMAENVTGQTLAVDGGFTM